MPVLDDQIAERQQAYHLLGVPHYASAHVIKAAYRKLVKRWHPDLYPAGTPDHAEATRMTMLLNQAYSAIAHAPLRYPSAAQAYRGESRQPYVPATPAMKIRIDPWELSRVDRLEFWIRFVCGAIFGVFSGGAWVLSAMSGVAVGFPVTAALGVIALAVGFGLAAARYGDKFWYSVLSSWDPFR
jgi:DnaJ domain